MSITAARQSRVRGCGTSASLFSADAAVEHAALGHAPTILLRESDVRAEDILPDGVDRSDFAGLSVRKGTVAAFLDNARVWGDAATGAGERANAERDMIEALPSLQAVGLFDVFAPRDARLAALLAEHAPGPRA